MAGYRKHSVDTVPIRACYAGLLRNDPELPHGACKSPHGQSRRHRVEPSAEGARGLRTGHPPRSPSSKSLHKQQRGRHGTGGITRAGKQSSVSTYALKRGRHARRRAGTRIRPGPHETYTQKSTEPDTDSRGGGTANPGRPFQLHFFQTSFGRALPCPKRAWISPWAHQARTRPT